MASSPSDAVFPMASVPYATGAILVGLVTALYLLYQSALPKPIPGIPYNVAATKRLLGDMAEIRQRKAEGKSTRTWFREQASRHNSPICQAFLAPFSRPAILISDYREAQDIMLRRSKEVDRSPRSTEAMGGVVRGHHISMMTADPQFKKNRELMKDLMSPNFLHTVRCHP
jgi:hypothetical protein